MIQCREDVLEGDPHYVLDYGWFGFCQEDVINHADCFNPELIWISSLGNQFCGKVHSHFGPDSGQDMRGELDEANQCYPVQTLRQKCRYDFPEQKNLGNVLDKD